MKNPYRSLLERPLRATVFVPLVILFAAKLFPSYEAVYDRALSPQQSVFLATVGLALALSCLLDVAVGYLLTFGWSALVERPWVIFLSPVVNLGAVLGSLLLYGPSQLLLELPRQPILLSALIVLGVLLLVQFIGSAMLFQRLR